MELSFVVKFSSVSYIVSLANGRNARAIIKHNDYFHDDLFIVFYVFKSFVNETKFNPNIENSMHSMLQTKITKWTLEAKQKYVDSIKKIQNSKYRNIISNSYLKNNKRWKLKAFLHIRCSQCSYEKRFSIVLFTQH